MSRVYKYVGLSPRGFGNEIAHYVACDNKEEFDEICELYRTVSARVIDFKYNDIHDSKGIKKYYVVPAYEMIKILKATGEEREKLDYELYEEEMEYASTYRVNWGI